MNKLALWVAIAVAAAMPVLAHHSVSAEFDTSKPIKVSGKVTKVEWTNPHGWVYLDVKNDKGELEHWQFEFGAPNELFRRGWKRSDVKEGGEIIVQGILAKQKSFTGNVRSITLPDGKQIFSGNAPGTGDGN
jgi:uncharacterized protein DUF6152